MNEKFNKNAKVEKFTNMLGIAVCLLVIDPFVTFLYIHVLICIQYIEMGIHHTMIWSARMPLIHFSLSRCLHQIDLMIIR